MKRVTKVTPPQQVLATQEFARSPELLYSQVEPCPVGMVGVEPLRGSF